MYIILTKQLLSLTSSSNPVLRNITDYLIEEASAEEEELLGGGTNSSAGGGATGGTGSTGEDKAEGEAIERDPSLITVRPTPILLLLLLNTNTLSVVFHIEQSVAGIIFYNTNNYLCSYYLV